ncbi:MAG: polysaccharide biosynthesis tyrosine autokinase [Gammaproteobacteria bacterium]|nr:polysaccharide biosynthesis tyrosine autokinase [Gammaproteobacteria bacterium]
MTDTAPKEEKPTHRSSQHGEGDVNLRELLAIVLARKWFVFFVMLVSLCIASLYVISIPPLYQTNALIQVNNKAEGMSGFMQSLSSSLTGSTSGAMPSQIEIALINSRFILEPTIEALDLNIQAYPKYFPIIGGFIARGHKNKGVAKPLFGLNRYSWGGEKILVKQFAVPEEFYNKSFLVKVEKDNQYKLYSPRGSLILEGKVGQVEQTKPDSAIPLLKILITELEANVGAEFRVLQVPTSQVALGLAQGISVEDMGEKLATSYISGVSRTGVLNLSFKGSNVNLLPLILNTIIDLDVQKNSNKKVEEAQKTLDFLNRQAETLKGELDQAESMLSNYKAKQGELGINLATRALLEKLLDTEKTLEAVKLKKSELLQEYTPLHPFVIAIASQQKKLQAELSLLESKVSNLPKSQQKALSLERDVAAKSKLYLFILGKIQQLQVIKAGTISDVRVLSYATKPIKLPSKTVSSILTGLIFGFILAVVIVFLRRALSKGIENPDYIEERLGIPLYAIIPFSRRQEQLGHEMKRKIPGRGPFVLAAISSKDLAIEGLRSLRTTLQFATQEAHNNVISILGSSPGIGKSFVSLNLAYVFADSGKKVLLIDADMRKGKINKYVCVTNVPGFAELLAGSATTEQAKRVLKQDQIDFIPTGKYPTNPAELLFSEKFKIIIEELKSHYDIVLIDTPPVLAVTDSILISKYSGSNVLVLGSGSEELPSVEHAVKRLKKSNVKVDGFVFNSSKELQHSYGYGYGNYGYYNYYYYDYNKDKK